MFFQPLFSFERLSQLCILNTISISLLLNWFFFYLLLSPFDDTDFTRSMCENIVWLNLILLAFKVKTFLISKIIIYFWNWDRMFLWLVQDAWAFQWLFFIHNHIELINVLWNISRNFIRITNLLNCELILLMVFLNFVIQILL